MAGRSRRWGAAPGPPPGGDSPIPSTPNRAAPIARVRLPAPGGAKSQRQSPLGPRPSCRDPDAYRVIGARAGSDPRAYGGTYRIAGDPGAIRRRRSGVLRKGKAARKERCQGRRRPGTVRKKTGSFPALLVSVAHGQEERKTGTRARVPLPVSRSGAVSGVWETRRRSRWIFFSGGEPPARDGGMTSSNFRAANTSGGRVPGAPPYCVQRLDRAVATPTPLAAAPPGISAGRI